MAITEEIRQIIFILEDEGFGALAGELLTEISLGREVEKEVYIDDQPGRASAFEAVVARIPIEPHDQLRVATDILRARLVLPVRAFVEAEKIASDLGAFGNVRISFIDPEQRTATAPISTRDVGDLTAVDELDGLLTRLPEMVATPTVDGV
jgi:hypothetical protein